MSVNKIILIGNVGKDPDVKYYENGGAVANFSLATTDRAYTTASGAQVPERTEWHNIVLWRGLAEIAEKYVRKGSKIFIEGKIRTRSYDDQQGVKRYVTEVWGENLELLDRKPDGGQGNQSPFPESSVGQATTKQNAAAPASETQAAPATPPIEKAENDDLPF
ncbi:MAG: single-stranded DNA-binding protein [Candidatus Symbiothrix sp.]|jgi:single-strand DNA-binding protein|nr:single-stranded DNA-binding protein [Candidatus Symbiothrix sp.]